VFSAAAGPATAENTGDAGNAANPTAGVDALHDIWRLSDREIGRVLALVRQVGRAYERLTGLAFPRNVPQLENVCHWLTVMAPAQLIEPKDLPPEIGDGAAAAEPVVRAAVPAETPRPVADTVRPAPAPAPASAAVGSWESALDTEAMELLLAGRHDVWDELTRRFESRLILTALANTRGRRIEAAQKLGIGRNTITRKIQELGLE